MITVIGSLNYDLVTTAQRIPDGGETVAASGFATHHGGKGANEALALARLSVPETKVAMVGLVGNDSFGDELVDSLKAEGVDVSKVGRSKERTGIATILVDGEGENRILVFPGANGEMIPERITSDLWKGSEFVLLQNEIPLDSTLKVLELATKANVKTVYNPSPILELPKSIFKNVSYLIINAIESAMISGTNEPYDENSAQTALDALLHLGVREVVVITLGAKGAVYAEAETGKRGFVPATRVDQIVDTTGAGDTFLAGIISRRALGETMEEALRFASKASAIVVGRQGAASSVPYLREIGA